MRVAILHDRVHEDSAPDTRDVLVQRDAVSEALAALGHRVVVLDCGLDLEDLEARIRDAAPDVAFNLVESLGGHDRLIHVVPSLLDALGLPFTGSPTEALYVTTGKILTKERLHALGLPTPSWATHPPRPYASGAPDSGGRFIVKSAWDHASIGLDDASVVDVPRVLDLPALLERRSRESGGEWFAERFVDGREFNLSVLGTPDGPVVLPCAEIVFENFPEGKPRIVGYTAKWAEDSFEYASTVRTFDFPPSDGPLLERITDLARSCFAQFGLGGYARVDFRIDPDSGPWILEINANPCLSPDAGFAAALERAGIAYRDAIGSILDGAVRLARGG